jgi:hypothetical protein
MKKKTGNDLKTYEPIKKFKKQKRKERIMV